MDASTHFESLIRMHDSVKINEFYKPILTVGEGTAEIEINLTEKFHHAAGGVHGSVYFKMLDDAAFYAANSLVSDRFILTTAFNLLFTRPLKHGKVTAEGRWVSGKRRVFVADSRLIDSEGEEIARGTGTFMRSHISLASLPGYKNDD